MKKSEQPPSDQVDPLLERIWFKKKDSLIVDRILEGDSETEIAAHCGMHLSSVKRRIAFLKKQTQSKTLHGLSVYLSRMTSLNQSPHWVMPDEDLQ